MVHNGRTNKLPGKQYKLYDETKEDIIMGVQYKGTRNYKFLQVLNRVSGRIPIQFGGCGLFNSCASSQHAAV